jgi:uncharacterized membrane protein
MKARGSRDAGPSRAVEVVVSLVLRIGVVLSATIICLGLALLVARGIISNEIRIDAAIPYPRDLGALLSGVFSLDPASVISLGLVVLIATPFARVAVSIVAFAIERDWRYVVVTALVLTILIAGIIMGKAVD